MRIPILVAALVAAAACTSSREHVDRVAADYSSAEPVGVLGRAEAPGPSAMPEARQRLATLPARSVSLPPVSITSNMVIRTGQTSVEVDSLERAVAQVRLPAGRVGGYVANTTMQTGRGQLRSATLEVKIPADRFDDGLGGVSARAKRKSMNAKTDDVGQGFTHVTSRMGNARRLEARPIQLLATRTGEAKGVVAV